MTPKEVNEPQYVGLPSLLHALDLAARFLGGQATPELAPGDSPDLILPIREAIVRLSEAVRKSDAEAEIRLDDDGQLDEVCAPGGHLERMAKESWFLEVGDVAVWLTAKSGRIWASYERRDKGKWYENEMERLRRCLAEEQNSLARMTEDRDRLASALKARNGELDDALQAAGRLSGYAGELEAPARDAVKIIRQYIEECGGCDHSVGICMCDVICTADTLDAALAKNPNPSGQLTAEALSPKGEADPGITSEASGPVGLGPVEVNGVGAESSPDACCKAIEAALRALEAHHVEQNRIKGRDESRSYTLRTIRATLAKNPRTQNPACVSRDDTVSGEEKGERVEGPQDLQPARNTEPAVADECPICHSELGHAGNECPSVNQSNCQEGK